MKSNIPRPTLGPFRDIYPMPVIKNFSLEGTRDHLNLVGQRWPSGLRRQLFSYWMVEEEGSWVRISAKTFTGTSFSFAIDLETATRM